VLENHEPPVGAFGMKAITLLVSEQTECTESPWWVIVGPSSLDLRRPADHITGPFFSRESAEEYLAARRYDFGRKAYVYCKTGCWSEEYKAAYHAGKSTGRVG